MIAGEAPQSFITDRTKATRITTVARRVSITVAEGHCSSTSTPLECGF